MFHISKNVIMKTMFLSILFALLANYCFSQSIPADSLYLGQTPPGSTPSIFKLQVTKGLVAAERIAITTNNKEIYYGELDSWPSTVQRIKCYKYLDNKWQGPFVAFEGYIAPSLSVNDSIMYMQKVININNSSVNCTFYSLRSNGSWTRPKRLLSTNLNNHYFQKTKQNNYYTASTLSDSPGGNSDLCKLIIHGTDTTIQSLGMPINTSATENDFYIAKDESYIIICRFNNGSASDLFISYKNENGSWTDPKTLGTQINTPNPNWEACPFVTKDNKYLFFMRGGNEMSSYFIYWVSIDKLIDSLRNTKL
jgi:hypothetical protein